MNHTKERKDPHIVSQMDTTSSQEMIECDRPEKEQRSREAKSAVMTKAPKHDGDKESENFVIWTMIRPPKWNCYTWQLLKGATRLLEQTRLYVKT